MADASSTTRSLAPPLRAPFVGREREMVSLRAELEIGLSGEGRVLLLAGEPGIGKTRTAEELAAAAVGHGALVVWGRCHEAEWTPPFWPWLQLLRAYAQQQPTDALRADLGTGATDIGQIVPEIAARLPHQPALPALAPEQARFRTFDHIAGLLRRAASRRPLMLILDDLHWADAPSLLLLEFVARDGSGAPLLVLGTYRDGEVGRRHPLARTLAELMRTDQTARFTLRGLNQTEVGRLVAGTGVAATSELVAAIHGETEGNPFFVHEVARLLASEAADDRGEGRRSPARRLPIPQSVREAIGRRLDQLSPSCNEVLAIAAVIGREFGLTVLTRVSDLASEHVLAALAEATTARLIEPVPLHIGAYRFAHALIRETLYAELHTVQRIRLHRQVGTVLEAVFLSDAEPHLAELAHHFVQAAPGGDASRAVAYARRAGERAMALLAFEEAAAHFELALDVLELLEAPEKALRCELLLLLAAAQLNAGDVAAGRATFQHTARLAKAAGLPEQLARAALGFGGEPIVAWGFDAELVRVLEDALALYPTGDSVLRAQLMTRLAIEYADYDLERMAGLSRDAEAMARRLGDARALANSLIGRLHLYLGCSEGWDALVATGRELAKLGETVEDRGLMWSGGCGELCGLLLAGDRAAVDRQVEVCGRVAAETRQPFYLFWTPTTYALLALLDGRLAEAERHIADALALAPRAHLAHWQWWYAPNLFGLRREQGRLVEAEQTLREVISTDPVPERSLTYRAMLAIVLLETGRGGDAQRELDFLAADDFAFARRQNQRDGNVAHGLGYLAEVCAALGDVPRAAALYGVLLPDAGHHLVYGGIWHTAGSASHFLGLLAATLERWNDADRHFADALAMNARLGARALVARTQVAYATMLTRRDAPGDGVRAQELTVAALTTASELGMVRVAADAAALQAKLDQDRASGAASAARRVGLTVREVEVLHLVVAGLSNPQIADSLYISPATARTHVSSILAKLGVHSRAEAVDYAHRHGLIPRSSASST